MTENLKLVRPRQTHIDAWMDGQTDKNKRVVYYENNTPIGKHVHVLTAACFIDWFVRVQNFHWGIRWYGMLMGCLVFNRLNVDGIQNKRNQKNIMGKWTIDPFMVIKRNNDDDDAKDRQRASAFIRSIIVVIKNNVNLHWKIIF